MYKTELIILVASGFFYAMATIMFYALTTVRQQNKTIISYAITSIFSIIIPQLLVRKYKMFGVAVSNVCITVVLFVMLTSFFIINLLKKKKIIC